MRKLGSVLRGAWFRAIRREPEAQPAAPVLEKPYIKIVESLGHFQFKIIGLDNDSVLFKMVKNLDLIDKWKTQMDGRYLHHHLFKSREFFEEETHRALVEYIQQVMKDRGYACGANLKRDDWAIKPHSSIATGNPEIARQMGLSMPKWDTAIRIVSTATQAWADDYGMKVYVFDNFGNLKPDLFSISREDSGPQPDGQS